MPADRIDQAIRRFSPEPVVCWCNGQSLESRYSSSTTSAGAFGGRAAGAAVLRHQLGKARLDNAVPLVYRYNPRASPDGMRGAEGTFSACSF